MVHELNMDLVGLIWPQNAIMEPTKEELDVVINFEGLGR